MTFTLKKLERKNFFLFWILKGTFKWHKAIIGKDRGSRKDRIFMLKLSCILLVYFTMLTLLKI